MKIIALDVHRTFAQVAILENGKIRDAGRLELEREHILKFAERLNVEDEIVLEATVNTKAIVRLLSPHVNRVVISNPLLVRAIAWAKVKTDKIDDTTTLAHCDAVWGGRQPLHLIGRLGLPF